MRIGYFFCIGEKGIDTIPEQIEALKQADCQVIFGDLLNSFIDPQSNLESVFEYAREGDILVIWQIFCLAPRLRQFVNIGQRLHQEKIGLEILVGEASQIKPHTPDSEKMLALFSTFANLEQKVYWYDEVSTSLTVVGYTEAEIVQSLNETTHVEPKALQKYQQFNSQKSVVDTVQRLVKENPHHPPLYYLIARFWSKIFGTSILAMRSLPAIISLLAFPCIYWLCLELFESSITGWVAVALIAISPLHLMYAQEARQYSLWIGIILLSSTALLRAVRVKTLVSWSLYGLTIVLGLYTQLFFGFVALGHGIYLVANEGFRLSKTVKSYLVTFLASLVMFSPWIVILIVQYSQANRLTEWAVIYDRTNEELIEIWIHNLSLAFFDIGQADYSDKFLILYVLVVSLVVSSIFFICRNTPRRIWSFILTLMGASALPLVLPDLLLSGQRTITPRYLIPTYLGIQLAVAYRRSGFKALPFEGDFALAISH